MPILASEPASFPDTLFQEPPGHEPSNRSWCVLHTRPRQEKSLARQLYQQRLPFYLPLVPKRSRMRNRIVCSYNPLFAGYVFLLATQEERIKALETGRVVRTLPVGDQAELWTDLRQVHRLIATGAAITAEDRLVPGTIAEIRTGPLAGLRGKIIRNMSGGRFVVEVNFICQGASVLLDDFNLTAVDEERVTNK
jgi:transcriptional antiterminator RfaH